MPGRRELVAATGVFAVAVGLAHREAFLSYPGAALLLLGLALLLFAALRLPGEPGRVYPVLLVLLCVVSALAPYDPAGINPLEATLTIGAAVAFYAFGVGPRLRPYRLYAAAALLVLAHGHYLLRFPHPLHQDVWTFLNFGPDMLARGGNPYLGVPFIEDGIHKVLAYTYPPGALLELAPFRLILGDVRWAYIVAEAAMVGLWALFLRSRGALTRPREALVLLPLALPRTSQAFYIFSNHELELLALALGALVLAHGRRDLRAGVLLGLGIASKQYFLVFPVMFMLPQFRRRSLVVAGAVAAALVLPFLAWAPGPFLRDVLGNLSQAPDPQRLTFWALASGAGITLPRAALTIMTSGALLVAAAAAWRTRDDPRRALLTCGLSLALFALCSSFAAYNYYAYALVFVTWGLLLPPTAPRARVDLAA